MLVVGERGKPLEKTLGLFGGLVGCTHVLRVSRTRNGAEAVGGMSLPRKLLLQLLLREGDALGLVAGDAVKAPGEQRNTLC